MPDKNGLDDFTENTNIRMLYNAGDHALQFYSDVPFNKISLYDINGKLLLNRETTIVENSIPIVLQKGIYIAKVLINNKTIALRLMIK